MILENQNDDKKLKSVKFSNNVKKIKAQLESKFDLFFEDHLNKVATLAKTSDDKYIVSGSKDKNVRIWNVLENRQKSVFYGHISRVLKVAVTSNNKFIVYGSDDKTARIWKV